MADAQEIAEDFDELPEVDSVEIDGDFIKVHMSVGLGLSPLNMVEDDHKDEIKSAGDHPDYSLSGDTMTVVYEVR